MFIEKQDEFADFMKSLISVCCAEQIDLNMNLPLRTPTDIHPLCYCCSLIHIDAF